MSIGSLKSGFPGDPLKNKLEADSACGFLTAIGSPYKVLRLGIPPEPDIICEHPLTRKQIGIEIVTAYYDDEHARSVWKPARGLAELPYYLTRSDPQENVRVLAEAARMIRAKCKKQYVSPGPLLLIVLTYPQRLYLCDVEDRLRTFRIPVTHPFNEIHILSQHGEVYGLFPSNDWILR